MIVILIVFVSTCIILSHSTRFKYLHHGNELEQFEMYEKLTAEALNVTDFITSVDSCERSIVPENGFRSYMCRYKLREQRQATMTPHWQRKEGDKKYKVDCKYKLQMIEQEEYSKFAAAVIEDNVLMFEIEQHTCHSSLRLLGGATFEIYLQSTRHLAVCNVIDLFNYKYKVYCPIPRDYHMNIVTTMKKLTLPEPANNMQYICSEVSVALHYEHFDAFDDIGHSKFSSLHHSVYKGPVCAQYNIKNMQTNQVSSTPSSSSSSSNSIVTATSDDIHSDPLWLIRPYTHKNDQYYFHNNEKLHNSIFGNQNTIYEWRGQIAKYLKVTAMKKCLNRQTLWFIGESHMRYQFDITMDRYINKLNMGRYHGNVNISGISYNDNTFSTRLIEFLDNLQCPKDSTEVQQLQTLVIQTGSWDLQFFPPRAFIRNPKQGTLNTVLYCTILLCTIYYSALYNTVLYCTLNTVLYCTILLCTIYYTALYNTILYCSLNTVLYCTILLCTIYLLYISI